ncbi:terminase large subunit domain-containing protein [Rhodococcus sp. AB351]|uniref:terminase large subunit domain-containing protein n=1 Tax=Rhodococcus sp. AB351 TaxID=3413280 RepID=UPI003C2441FE
MTHEQSAVRSLTAARSLRAARRRRRPSHPAELAAAMIPDYRVTPAIALLADVLHDAIMQPGRRYIVTVPPREGKSTLISQVGVLAALRHNPDARVILAAYGDDLAREHSHEARALIAEHADLLGFRLSQDKTAVGRWRVEGRRGGLLAAGILSGITGFGADLLLIDDPTKNMQEADSATHRSRVLHEFRSTLMTRLHPGASVVLVQTRWHESDLAGTLLAEEPERWQHVNIPAIAEHGVPDALGREPGAVLTSAPGRTAEDFADLRRSVGERVWHALYQGIPTPPGGGLIRREWFEQWRLPAPPEYPVATVVGVDPSDSGRGDACGLVAASRTRDGVVTLIRDVSEPMTSEQWAQRAVDLAVEVGASEIAVEGYTARETYIRVVRDALRRRGVTRPIRVTSWPPKGAGRLGDAAARSAPLIQALEVGTCRLAGHFPELEDAAVRWQAGQHQPDSLAAFVIAHDVLARGAGAGSIAAPIGTMQRSPVAGPRPVGGARPDLDALVAASAARNRALAEGRDPDAAPEVLHAREMHRRARQWAAPLGG